MFVDRWYRHYMAPAHELGDTQATRLVSAGVELPDPLRVNLVLDEGLDDLTHGAGNR